VSNALSSVRTGYDRWAAVYDHDANPLPPLEEPAVHAAIGEPRYPMRFEGGASTYNDPAPTNTGHSNCRFGGLCARSYVADHDEYRRHRTAIAIQLTELVNRNDGDCDSLGDNCCRFVGRRLTFRRRESGKWMMNQSNCFAKFVIFKESRSSCSARHSPCCRCG